MISSSRHSVRLQLAGLAALLIIAWLAYWPGRTGGFVFDDYPNIVDNTAVHVVDPDWSNWLAASMSSPARSLPRPLAMLTFAVNHYLTGLNPVALKLTNVAIHLFNILLVFGLIRCLFRAPLLRLPVASRNAEWAALLVAAAWALHPINVSAVLLIVQRMESLSHTFVFAGLWLYAHGRMRQIAGQPGWMQVSVGIVLFALLGISSKESAALLPLYAFCMEVAVFRFDSASKRDPARLKAFFCVVLLLPALAALAWLLPKALAPGAFGSRDFNLWERLMTESRVVLDYLGWIALPDVANLSLYHDDYVVSRGLLAPPSTLMAIVGILALASGAWILRQIRPLAALGLAWFLGAQLLTATIIPLELVFEHRNYFASLGISLVLVDLLAFAPSSPAARRMGVALGLAATVLLAGLTFLRSKEWSSPVSFAVSEAAKHPQSPRATYYLGWMLANASGYRPESELIEPAFRAFDRARAIPNSNILPDQGALVLASRTRQPLRAEWWDHMRSKLRERPIGPQETGGLNGLVTCSLERKCAFPADDMVSVFAAALSQGPNAEVLSVYANYVLNVLGEPELALRLWREARELNPREPEYRVSLVKLLIVMDRPGEARREIEQLRRLGRLGQYSAVAEGLEKRLQASARAP